MFTICIAKVLCRSIRVADLLHLTSRQVKQPSTSIIVHNITRVPWLAWLRILTGQPPFCERAKPFEKNKNKNPATLVAETLTLIRWCLQYLAIYCRKHCKQTLKTKPLVAQMTRGTLTGPCKQIYAWQCRNIRHEITKGRHNKKHAQQKEMKDGARDLKRPTDSNCITETKVWY